MQRLGGFPPESSKTYALTRLVRLVITGKGRGKDNVFSSSYKGVEKTRMGQALFILPPYAGVATPFGLDRFSVVLESREKYVHTVGFSSGIR